MDQAKKRRRIGPGRVQAAREALRKMAFDDDDQLLAARFDNEDFWTEAHAEALTADDLLPLTR